MRVLTLFAMAACSVEAPPLPDVGPAPVVDPDATVPVFGGTLAATSDLIVAADPSVARLWGVETDLSSVRWERSLEPGAQPFRIQPFAGTAYVTLRGTGEVIAVDLADGVISQRARVCAEPRGVDVDEQGVVVACASRELVELDHALAVQSRHVIEPDLRDVVLESDKVLVSRFRAADVLVIDRASGALQRRIGLGRSGMFLRGHKAHVAWRMRRGGSHSALILHQGATHDAIRIEPPPDPPQGGLVDEPDEPPPPPAYGALPIAACGGDPRATLHISQVTTRSGATGGPILLGSGAFDFAATDAGLVIPLGQMTPVDPDIELPRPAGAVWLSEPDALGNCIEAARETWQTPSKGIVTSVELVDGGPVFLTRHPTSLVRFPDVLVLDPGDRDATGAFRAFHEPTASGLSCATCHPEGQDDGHVWNFVEVGPRRTQNLSGGLGDRAPFHWDGEFADLEALLDDVLVERMGGNPMAPPAVQGLGDWMHAIPVEQVRPVAESTVVAEGKRLFDDEIVGCAGCHVPPGFTDNQLHRVRPDDPPFKTPSLLGVGARGPFMHDGCAETLEDRFLDRACGGGDLHGRIGHLSGRQLNALIAYVQTL